MKSKKVTKFLSMILAGVMAIGMTACSGKTDDASSASTQETTSASKEESVASQEEQTKTLADYDKVDSFNYYNIAAGVSDDELNAHPMAKMVADQTGYNVTYTQAPADGTDAQTAITNIFLLKQDYQAVKVSKNQFYTLLAMNALAPITEYVNASTNLKEDISAFGWDTATKDGEIYAIPQKNAAATSSVGIC